MRKTILKVKTEHAYSGSLLGGGTKKWNIFFIRQAKKAQMPTPTRQVQEYQGLKGKIRGLEAGEEPDVELLPGLNKRKLAPTRWFCRNQQAGKDESQ